MLQAQEDVQCTENSNIWTMSEDFLAAMSVSSNTWTIPLIKCNLKLDSEGMCDCGLHSYLMKSETET